MAHHVLRDVDRHMRLPIMHPNGHRHHFRENHRSTRPRLDHPAVATALHTQHFLSERLMNVRPLFSRARHLLPPPTSIATPDDELVRSLIFSCPITQRRLAPGGLRLSTNRRTPLTATMWMVARVHCRATNGRTTTQVPGTPGFTETLVLMINVAHRANGGHTQDIDSALLTRRQTQQCIVPLFRHQLCACTCPTHHLGATPSFQFNTMNGGTRRNVL